MRSWILATDRHHSRRFHAQECRQVQDDCRILEEKGLCRDRRKALAQTGSVHEALGAAQVHLKSHPKAGAGRIRIFLFVLVMHKFSSICVSGSWNLRHWVPVYSWPSRNVEDPSQIAIVVAHAAVVPAVVLAQVVGITAIIDEMVAENQIPARGEGEINAVSILFCRVSDKGVIAAVICQIQSLFII